MSFREKQQRSSARAIWYGIMMGRNYMDLSFSQITINV